MLKRRYHFEVLYTMPESLPQKCEVGGTLLFFRDKPFVYCWISIEGFDHPPSKLRLGVLCKVPLPQA
jgi:hypothetical protein